VSSIGLKINQNAQKRLFDPVDISIFSPQSKGFDLETTYPGFITGSGMSHGVKGEDDDFKIGFFFDHTTGLPVIPGSTVKGTIRSVFPDYKKGATKDNIEYKNEVDEIKAQWVHIQLNSLSHPQFLTRYSEPEPLTEENKQYIFNLTKEIFEGVKPDGTHLSVYERDIFHDAFISKKGKEGRILGKDAITPHVRENLTYEASLLKNPVPLSFIKVIPQVSFSFQFDLKDGLLSKEKKELLFKKVLLTVGIGAKTNVGYGQLKEISKPAKATKTEEGKSITDSITEITEEMLPFLTQGSQFSGEIIRHKKDNFIIAFTLGDGQEVVVKKKKFTEGIPSVGAEVEIILGAAAQVGSKDLNFSARIV